MAATYAHLARRRAKRQERHRTWRNIATGAVILGVLVVCAVWGGGLLSGIKTLRRIGTGQDGRPIYG